mgnify:CR=1 FL=1
MVKTKDEDMWYWYEHVEQFKKSGLGKAAYCKAHNLQYEKFCNMIYRIDYKKYEFPEEHARLLSIYRQYEESDLIISDFCKAYNFSRSALTCIQTHLKYQKIIERLKIANGQNEPKESTMTFVQVPKRVS